ncbi:MAG: hypothetical protein OXR72_01345 [Gemmatimonadota bacterium]|nr:hypothetical protein [Gemmatimonadota bacterium]
MFRKSIALLCASCVLWTSLVGAGQTWAAESGAEDAKKAEGDGEDRPKTTRTIEGLEDAGWAIVDVRQIEGNLVVLSPLVGPEIDLEESNRYSLFQGRSVYNERVPLRLLDMAIPGIQTATFLKSGDRVMVRIRYRSGPKIANRTVPVGDEDALRRLREYVEHFDEVRKGEYKIGFESKLPEDAEYPKYTDRKISFEERRPRAGITRRLRGGVVLKDGERIEGQLLPEYDDGTILVQSGLDARRVPVNEIDRVLFLRGRRSTKLGTAVRMGVGGAVSGALVGAFAGWQSNSPVRDTAILFGAISGAIGFFTGLFRSGGGPGKREFVLGPVDDGRDRNPDGDGDREKRERSGR